MGRLGPGLGPGTRPLYVTDGQTGGGPKHGTHGGRVRCRRTAPPAAVAAAAAAAAAREAVHRTCNAKGVEFLEASSFSYGTVPFGRSVGERHHLFGWRVPDVVPQARPSFVVIRRQQPPSLSLSLLRAIPRTAGRQIKSSKVSGHAQTMDAAAYNNSGCLNIVFKAALLAKVLPPPPPPPPPRMSCPWGYRRRRRRPPPPPPPPPP